MQYTSLTADKILNSLIYRTLFYLNMYVSYKVQKTVRFWPTLYIHIYMYISFNSDTWSI